MQMTDILPVAAWAELEQDITRRFGVNAHVYNDKGQPFTGHATWENRLCLAIRETKSAATGICAVINQALGHEVRETKAPAITDCDAGMLVVCVPLFIKGELVGMVGGCGGFADDNEPETFLLEKMAGLAEDKVEEICAGMPRKTAEEVQAMSDYIEARVAEIVKEYEARQGN